MSLSWCAWIRHEYSDIALIFLLMSSERYSSAVAVTFIIIICKFTMKLLNDLFFILLEWKKDNLEDMVEGIRSVL